MKHPALCGACAPPCNPCCETPRRYLLDRVVCSGREWIRCLDTCLCVTGLCDCLPAPLTLTEVCWSGAPVCGRPCADAHGALVYEVEIPLRAVIRDAACCLHEGCAKVCIKVCLRCPPAGACGRAVFIPSVRLACGPVCSQGLSFDARLTCDVEGYLVRPEVVCMHGPDRPAPPKPLPLYPVPYDYYGN